LQGTPPRHKHLLLDQGKIEKAQKALGARTETETIERALEIVIGEDERNHRAWAATEKLVKNGILQRRVWPLKREVDDGWHCF